MFASIGTGHVQHLDQVVAVPAWIGNFLIIVGSVWAYAQLPKKELRDAVRLVIAFVLTTGFFAACIAVLQPAYLPLFSGIFHPHAP
jgi:hypothetical protein